jgi:lysophospholipase L1-like esterase
MPRISYSLRGAALLACVGAVAACSTNKDIVSPPVPVGGALFESYVALGNSLTAGYQSGGINDSTQRESYAVLLAHAMGTRFALPLLAEPGCPPPIDNFQTQHRVGGGTSTTCALRVPTSITGIINNVAVPGATSVDPTATTSPASNTLTQLILGGESQAKRAHEADPTFVSVWIGNNDVLEAAVSGMLAATPGVSPGVTPVDDFSASYGAMLDSLTTAPTLQGGVLIGVVNVSQVPVLFPAALLVNSAQVRAAFEAATGGSVTIHPSCTATTTSLISFLIVPQIRLFRTDPANPAAHPPVIACEKNQPGVPAPVGDIFVLDAAEQASITSTVNDYNAFIQERAKALGWAYYDPNVALANLRGQGLIPPFPNLADPTKPYGDYISLDGIHPAKAAHLLIANALVDAINAQYGTTIGSITQ